MTVDLRPSTPSPAPVGKMITWTASADSGSPGTLWYRFRVRRIGESFRVAKDYSPDNSFEWSATDHEGRFEIEASVRNLATREISAAKSQFEATAIVTGRAPVVSPTDHPLVFLYSAPPCAGESRMRIRFEAPGDPPHFTPWKSCKSGATMNFYLAGMYPETPYIARHIVDTGSAFHEGPAIVFNTERQRIVPVKQTVVQARDGGGLMLQSTIGPNLVATDLDGELMWYYPKPVMLMTQPSRGGTIWAIFPGGVIREFDVAGMTLTETNVARVNEQLAALGKGPINGFHHEVSRLPDGRVMVLASEERIVNDLQGPGPVDVVGDMIIVMNRDLQVVWTWDAFDHLDVKRKATLNEICAASCATLAKTANDWTHANSLQQTPDGNLLLSARNQDFVYKIAYENGEGDGHVIWKLGNGGDFQLKVADPLAWFSHQHDARFAGDGRTITLFDNSNVRQSLDPKAHSRGQAIRIDEQSMTAELVLNADLGVFSSALGSAQKLPNGHFVFLSGSLPGNTSLTTEVDENGKIVYQLRTASQQYRTFRMRDLYTAPE